MKFLRIAARSLEFSRQCGQRGMVRGLSTRRNSGSLFGGNNDDDLEKKIFDGLPGRNLNNDPFFDKLDNADKMHDKFAGGSRSAILDGDTSFQSTLSDGMDGKLKQAAARSAPFDVSDGGSWGSTFLPRSYGRKEKDFSSRIAPNRPKRQEFETTTAEVLKKADFRNVRFLSNFITDAGIIIKRSKTKISAKAQRKIAREIKTARAFGLMPFTTMGQDPFSHGTSREVEEYGDDEDYDDYRNISFTSPFDNREGRE